MIGLKLDLEMVSFSSYDFLCALKFLFFAFKSNLFCRHYEKFQTKKTLKCNLELNFNNFQERKNGKVLG